MQLVIAGLVKLIKGYAVKLATAEFIEWVLFEIAEAAVKSTKTPHDDKLLEKLKEILL
jgi:hypothetical protein